MPVSVKSSEVAKMFGRIATRYDLANNVLSCGIHLAWRRALVRAVPKDASVLDVATGTGGVLELLSRRCRSSVGVDFCYPMLSVGSNRGVDNLVCGDGLQLPFRDHSFSAVTVAFGVRNFQDPRIGLAEMKRVISPSGKLCVLEFGQPRARWFREVYDLYSKHLLPVIGTILTGERSAYEYLPETSKHFPCGERFCDMLSSVGFREAKFVPLTGGIAYLYEASVD